MKGIIPQTIQPSFNHLIGIPYEHKNCWELVKQFYSDILKIGLKHYVEGTPDERERVKSLIFTNMGDFQKVDSPIFGDIVILKIYGIECHIGVYVGEGMILHTTKGTGSHLDRLQRWSKVVVGFYRAREVV